MAAIGAFLGHLYPVWLRFRGGKGVATLIGIVAALHWPTRAGRRGGLDRDARADPLFLARRAWSAALAAPVAAALFGRFDLAILFLGFALLVLWKHRANIGRLFAGTEPKVGRKAA